MTGNWVVIWVRMKALEDAIRAHRCGTKADIEWEYDRVLRALMKTERDPRVRARGFSTAAAAPPDPKGGSR